MKDFFGVDFRAAVRKVVKAELKELFGIKVPKTRENKSHRSQVNISIINFHKIFSEFLRKVSTSVLGKSGSYRLETARDNSVIPERSGDRNS